MFWLWSWSFIICLLSLWDASYTLFVHILCSFFLLGCRFGFQRGFYKLRIWILGYIYSNIFPCLSLSFSLCVCVCVAEKGWFLMDRGLNSFVRLTEIRFYREKVTYFRCAVLKNVYSQLMATSLQMKTIPITSESSVSPLCNQSLPPSPALGHHWVFPCPSPYFCLFEKVKLMESHSM